MSSRESNLVGLAFASRGDLEGRQAPSAFQLLMQTLADNPELCDKLLSMVHGQPVPDAAQHPIDGMDTSETPTVEPANPSQAYVSPASSPSLRSMGKAPHDKERSRGVIQHGHTFGGIASNCAVHAPQNAAGNKVVYNEPPKAKQGSPQNDKAATSV